MLVVSLRHYGFADMLIDDDRDVYRLFDLFETKEELPALFALRKAKLSQRAITFEQFSAMWQRSPLAALRRLFLYPLTDKDLPILLKSMVQTKTTIEDVYLHHMEDPGLAPFRIIHITEEAICC